MKSINCFRARGAAVLLGVGICLVLAACAGAVERTVEETAVEQEPAEAQDMEPAAEEEDEPLQEAISPADEPTAVLEAAPTALPITIEPTPDFGSIAYDVPTGMVRQQEVQVILLVSPTEEEDLQAALVEELQEVGQEPENVQTATVEMAKRMSATLTGAPQGAFEIVSLQANDEQFIRDDEPTQWEWTVVPLQGGTHRLILRIDRLVERDGIVEPFKEEVHRDDVTVEVPVGLRLQDAWGSFDLKWLAGVLLFPLLFYWLNRRDKKRDQAG